MKFAYPKDSSKDASKDGVSEKRFPRLVFTSRDMQRLRASLDPGLVDVFYV